MMDNPRRAALYTRVSTLDQARDGYSLTAQRKALEAWAKGHGYTVSALYSDEGISGRDIKHRPAMCAMLDAVKQGGHIYKGNHPPIIDMDTWEAVQTLLNN